MKKIIILSFLIVTSLVNAQEDTLKYRRGFMVEFQSITVQQIGFRYRLSNESKIKAAVKCKL